jgi:pimeloyl-ACP methyl ester carboxylesterase
MSGPEAPAPLEVSGGGVSLAGERAGADSRPPIVLLHGLTATRRYVVHGSRYLPRHGFATIAYDARGHGESSPAPDSRGYEYADQVRDLEAVLTEVGAERAVLAGNSMGAATAMAFALAQPGRVAALVQITPAFDARPRSHEELVNWDALADGLEGGGVEGFIDAYSPSVDGRWRDTVLLVTRQRLERHRHPGAVADALRVVPRSMAYDSLDRLDSLETPTLVVGSRDDADPGHPLAVAEEYAGRLPNAELLVEEEGKSPLAWQGAQLSRAIADFVERHS